MGKKKTANRDTFIITAICIILIAVVFIVSQITPKEPYELKKGNSSRDFCIEKCNGKEVYASNNNSNYNFIGCECITNLQTTIFGGVFPITKMIYFDSQTYQELNETEVIKRIGENNNEEK